MDEADISILECLTKQCDKRGKEALTKCLALYKRITTKRIAKILDKWNGWNNNIQAEKIRKELLGG